MSPSEVGTGDPTVKTRPGFVRAFRSNLNQSWLGRNWQTAVVLALLVFLAFFLRTYFVYGPSVDNGYLLSGGSDSYYHQRVIDYATSTGHHLTFDPMLNYPVSLVNARPPLYDWSVAVSGTIWATITGSSVADGTGFSLVLSTAVWGALTIIPVFMIGRSAFGKKAGMAAALLFAIMPAHIQRSVFSDADHDAMVLFFVVFGFYFLLESLKSINGDKWVASWKSPKAIKEGVALYFRSNQSSVIYALLAGVCIAAVAFIWTGFMYVLIIVLAYLLVQIFINRFKNIDSFGAVMTISLMLGLALLLAAPMYAELHFWGTWFDVPAMLFIAALIVGLFFTVTRDYPWTLAIPVFVVIAVISMAGLAIFAPHIFEAIITGQGYLVKSKLYSTISEAQAPSFSDLAMSFGVLTFWFALVGLAWAAIKIPKNTSPYFIFVTVWVGAAIYMAASAGRFVFNAAPVFAISAGWILVLLVDMIKFEDVPKGFAGIKIFSNPLVWMRKAFKVKHVAGALFLGFLIILPNVWTAVDASIPANYKADYDMQVYNVMPDFLRPSGYDVVNGTNWYFGAFSYSLPLPKSYFPAAWSWFNERDQNITPAIERPAFLSWWDYGFEAIQAGGHPAVADNFQDGYNFAGSYITCQNETEAIAMLIVRSVEGQKIAAGSDIANAMIGYGVDYAKFYDMMTKPVNYISTIQAHPEIYGNFDSQMSAANAKYVVTRVELAKLGYASLVSLYHDVRSITGNDIGYFAVDSRLFPFSATGNNIFYAPAKLSDHRIDSVTNAPIDFFEIKALTSDNELVDIANVTSAMTVTNYVIVYKQAFYETMLYRAFMGFGPSDVGQTTQGIPGFSGSLSSTTPLQGWNMSHFRVVYKTAYYNPFTDYANHTDAWKAVSYEEAVSLKAKIDAGLENGIVDLSVSGLAQGIVFLQYYDGAIIQGTVASASGHTYPDVYVTVVDDYGVPHQTVKTDANGHYSVVAPFGKVSVVFSTGSLDKRTQIAASVLKTLTFDITYDQAMRNVDDVDNSGLPDYYIDGDVTLTGMDVSGQLFWDLDASGTYTASSDELIAGAKVIVENTTTGFYAENTSTASGFQLLGLPPMSADLYAIVDGHKTTTNKIKITTTSAVQQNIAVKPGSINGTVTLASGSAAANFPIIINDLTNGSSWTVSTNSTGFFSFGRLLSGNYTLQSGTEGITLGEQRYALTAGEKIAKSITLQDALTLSGKAVTFSGLAAQYATITISSAKTVYVANADASGNFALTIPVGTYDIQFIAIINDQQYTSLQRLTGATGEVSYNPVLEAAYYLTGHLSGASSVSGLKVSVTSRTTGASVHAITNSSGNFKLLLPVDNYFVNVQTGSKVIWTDVFVSQPVTTELSFIQGVTLSGKIWYDTDADNVRDSSEGRSGVTVFASDVDGRAASATTSSDGSYSIPLIAGRTYTLSVNEPGFESFSSTYAPLDASLTQNIELFALNRTIEGVLTYLGAPLSGIIVSFQSAGQAAIDASTITDTNGYYSMQLHPGLYDLVIDENLTFGSNATRYQFSERLTIKINGEAITLNIAATKRVLVTGSISPDRSTQTSVTFTGPEKKQVSATTSFSIYLMEGNYSVYAFVERLGGRYADLFTQTIGPGATSVTIVTEQAYLISGGVNFQGSSLRYASPVSVERSTGGVVKLTTSTSGSFSTYVPAGNYTTSVDLRTKELNETKQRYVRYTGSITFDITANKVIRIASVRSFDNVTVNGAVMFDSSPVSASLEFVSNSQSAMSTTTSVTPSGYSIEIAPGEYYVYAREIGGTGAYLGNITVTPYLNNHLNVTLAPGLRFNGLTLLAGTPASALVEITSQYYKAITSAADGNFEVYLPAGDYDVKATATGTERGVSVQYLSEFALNLTDPITKVIDLQQQRSNLVDISWDSTEKRTIDAGETVSYNVRIENKGNVIDTYKLSTTSVPSGWTVTFSKSSVTVDFGASDNSQLVLVTITTPSTAKTTDTTVTVKATSSNSVTVVDSVSLKVAINPRYAVSLSSSTPQSTTGSTYTFNMIVKNTGNIVDSYLISILNADELATLGWQAEVRPTSGTFGQNLTISVNAGVQSTYELRLTPTRENPDPTLQVVLTATSKTSSTVNDVFAFSPELPKFTVPGGGITVTGDQVSSTAPIISTGTIILVALVLAMTTILMLISLQKGVFKRRKR
jgi:asparagine N-glycosylation enzyme membrane subunit Stt3